MVDIKMLKLENKKPSHPNPITANDSPTFNMHDIKIYNQYSISYKIGFFFI